MSPNIDKLTPYSLRKAVFKVTIIGMVHFHKTVILSQYQRNVVMCLLMCIRFIKKKVFQWLCYTGSSSLPLYFTRQRSPKTKEKKEKKRAHQQNEEIYVESYAPN